MPVSAWIPIAVFVLGTAWSVGVWLVGRRLARQDKLEELVVGKEGLQRQVDRLVTRTEFQERHVQIEDILQRISEEGQEREQRIRDQVDNVRRSTEQDMREVRRELAEIHQRLNAAARASRR